MLRAYTLNCGASNQIVRVSRQSRSSTLLAPDIVEAILGGRQSANLPLALLMRSFPVEWQEQRAKISAPHAS
jgi:hypothetical protein